MFAFSLMLLRRASVQLLQARRVLASPLLSQSSHLFTSSTAAVPTSNRNQSASKQRLAQAPRSSKISAPAIPQLAAMTDHNSQSNFQAVRVTHSAFELDVNFATKTIEGHVLVGYRMLQRSLMTLISMLA